MHVHVHTIYLAVSLIFNLDDSDPFPLCESTFALTLILWHYLYSHDRNVNIKDNIHVHFRSNGKGPLGPFAPSVCDDFLLIHVIACQRGNH